MSCLFCEIIKGKVPAKIVYEDELALAFEDISPQAPTHLLIIPKQHIESLNDASNEDADTLAHLLLTAKSLAKAQGLDEAGYRVLINTNEHGGQTVYHLHVHLLGGRKLSWPPG